MDFNIRPINIGDGVGVNLLRRMSGVFENLHGIPSERVKRNEDAIANMDDNQHQFVATVIVNGEELIIGTAGLAVEKMHRVRHSGSIGIMVHKQYQNQGVGTALLNTLIDLADNWLMLVRVELSVYQDNKKAIHLYEKFGFVKEGVKRFASIRNGKYEDEIIMARISPSMC